MLALLYRLTITMGVLDLDIQGFEQNAGSSSDAARVLPLRLWMTACITARITTERACSTAACPAWPMRLGCSAVRARGRWALCPAQRTRRAECQCCAQVPTAEATGWQPMAALPCAPAGGWKMSLAHEGCALSRQAMP